MLLAIRIGENPGAVVRVGEESPEFFHVRGWQESREGRVGIRGIGKKNN